MMAGVWFQAPPCYTRDGGHIWGFDTDEDGDFWLHWLGSPSGYRQVVLFSEVAEPRLTKVYVAAHADTKASLEHYWQILDFFNRINDGSSAAIWCLDPDEGTISCKHVLWTNVGMSEEMARVSCMLTCGDMNLVMAQVMTICYGSKSGAAAYLDYKQA